MPDAPGLSLASPLSSIRGVGPRRTAALATIGLTSVGKLIAHLPARHERLEAEATIDQLAAGSNSSTRGDIAATRIIPRRPRPRFEAVLVDSTGRLDLTWFNALYLRDKLRPGMTIRVQGQAKRRGPGLQMINPQWQAIDPEREPPAREARIRPIYPATESVPSRTIEEAVLAILDAALPLIEDHLSPEFRRQREFPALADAYRMMHSPASLDEVAAARRRLAYDEFLLLQLGVHLKRAHLREQLRAPALRWSPQIDRHIRERFPFELTQSQQSVIADLARDLASDTPTNRLIQGDVGSGKTVVALYAMLMAVASEQQAAIMAPTEILAEQHAASISAMLAGSRTRVQLLTGATPAADRAAILARCEAGEIDILVGTHALLTESVRFASLAVAVIDEQHRFGVHQRATLRAKATAAGDSGAGITPHVLVMTATPIPRTLAITLFGDLDISTIAGLPPGRQPIATRVVEHAKRPEVYSWLRERLDKGEQAYIVAPTIGAPGTDDDSLLSEPDDPTPAEPAAASESLASVRALYKELEAGPLAGKRLAVLHGRLKRDTRERIMERFRSGQLDALIATTVIEVGVDVPNASVMIVESADRFGLSQLHQLRGRVGRGSRKSACILISSSGELTPDATERLAVIAKTSDGFILAERDMEIRGPGELFGVRQSGLAPFKVADLARDLDLLKMARRDAAAWIASSPHLSRPEDALARRRLLRAHGQWLGLGDVG